MDPATRGTDCQRGGVLYCHTRPVSDCQRGGVLYCHARPVLELPDKAEASLRGLWVAPGLVHLFSFMMLNVMALLSRV